MSHSPEIASSIVESSMSSYQSLGILSDFFWLKVSYGADPSSSGEHDLVACCCVNNVIVHFCLFILIMFSQPVWENVSLHHNENHKYIIIEDCLKSGDHDFVPNESTRAVASSTCHSPRTITSRTVCSILSTL